MNLLKQRTVGESELWITKGRRILPRRIQPPILPKGRGIGIRKKFLLSRYLGIWALNSAPLTSYMVPSHQTVLQSFTVSHSVYVDCGAVNLRQIFVDHEAA